jgi:hypothetical protein
MTKYEYITDEYQTKTKTRAIDILEGDRIINTLQYESFKKEAAPDES